MEKGIVACVLALAMGSALFCGGAAAQDSRQTPAPGPAPCVIALADTTTHYQPLLTGAPQTSSMEAGLVILGGQGEMTIEGGTPLSLRAGVIAYCPVETGH